MSKTNEFNTNHLKKCVCNFCMSKWIFSIGDVLENNTDGKKITILALGLRANGKAILFYSTTTVHNVERSDFEGFCEMIHCIPNVEDFAGTYNYWQSIRVKENYKLVTK